MNNSTSNSRSFFGMILAVVVIGLLLYGIWLWGFCRFYVRSGYMAIITAKDGRDLEPGQILAKPDQKGIREAPLAEGRYFLNPVIYDWEIVKAVKIPAGKLGVVTAKEGRDLPPGEFLAGDGEKGIWRKVLGPGTYRMNPHGYDITITDAISIPIGYVGVMTSLSGGKAPEGMFAGPNQKGVREDILQPGLYYVNPNEFKIDVLEIGVNQVSLIGKEGGQVLTKGQMETQNTAMEELQSNVLSQQKQRRQDYLAANAPPQMAPQAAKKLAPGKASQQNAQTLNRSDTSAAMGLKQFVEFPSKDGFQIQLDMTVEFELPPTKIAQIFLKYGDLPAVVDKIIMPQILSVSRLKGSSYRAQDLIAGEGREKFQTELKETLAKVLLEREIIVHNSLIRHVEVPQDIMDPIQQASLAIEQDLTNKAKQEMAKKQAELNTQESLIEQSKQTVQQETEKITAEIAATTEKEVATIQAEAGKTVAEIAKETAGVKAEITRCLGEAKSKVIGLVNGEQAKGFQLKVKALGDPAAYTLNAYTENLNPKLTLQILSTGPGTLWTDLKGAGLGDLGGARLLSQPAAPAVPAPAPARK